MQAPPADLAPPPLQQQQQRHKSASSAPSGGATATVVAGDLKCPELLVRGTDLQLRVPLESLFKKVQCIAAYLCMCTLLLRM